MVVEMLRKQNIEATPEQAAAVWEMMKTKNIEYIDGQSKQTKKRNISFVSDLWPLCDFFFIAPETFDREDKFVRKNWTEHSAAEMRELRDILAALPAFDADTQRTAVDAWVAEKGCKPWNAWRVCLVGQGKGPDMHELAAFLGREETLRRMDFAISQLG